MKNQIFLQTLLIGIILLYASIVTPVQAQDGGMLARINGLRAAQGLPPYRVNGALAAAAQAQAQWIAQTGTMSHNRPDGSTVRTRTAAAGYASSWVGENIYGGINAS